jgi:hypothetical protein
MNGTSNGAPASGGSYSAGNVPQGNTISRAQIRDFYDPRHRGRYTDEQRRQIEQAILDAGRQGRIVGK